MLNKQLKYEIKTSVINKNIKFNHQRKFQLDRLIKEYQRYDKQTNITEIKLNRANNISIEIYPLRKKQPINQHKRRLQELSYSPKGLNQSIISQNRYSNRQYQRQSGNAIKLSLRSLDIRKRNKSKRYQTLASINLYNKKQNRSSHSILKLPCKVNFKRIQQRIQKPKCKLTWSYRTYKGYSSKDQKKPNQDSYLIKDIPEKKTHAFAIADGHGQNGHLVSQFVVRRLQSLISQQVQTQNSLAPLFSQTYNKLQDMLFKTNLFDVCLSGTTLLTLLIQYPRISCANVGDSRAVLVRQIDSDNWEVIHLSDDHKPSLPKEKNRILKKGGKIYSCKDSQGYVDGPLRVWLPNKDYPGLAMSRSLGDNLCKKIGVTHEPEVVEMQIEKEDKFIILASDGVWQSVNSNQIIKFLVPLYIQNKLQQCCDALMRLCLAQNFHNPHFPKDDVTFILIFINER